MNRNRQHGYNLLEVLIAIVIFAIGMLALASLQGNLTRSAADANARTVAVNLAEGLIEQQRGFGRLSTDPDGVIPAYADITGATTTKTHKGIDYTITSSVTPYYYDLATDSFTTTSTGGTSDFKLTSVTVSWSTPDFRSQEGSEIDVGSGSITVVDSFSAQPVSTTSRVQTQVEGGSAGPSIWYTPGQNPDVVSLSLGGNKFKESLLPQPKVTVLGELVQTKFEVVTYSSNNEGSQFLRREEFQAVSCECTLKAPPGNASDAGRRPTVWIGDEYSDPPFVEKAYGTVRSGVTQSKYCDVCCRDHHDGGSSAEDSSDSATNLYYPFRNALDYHLTGTFSGDHKHYNVNDSGALVLANTDANYLEACKLIRKDGFWQVAQDFRQEDLHVFPKDFLDENTEVSTYSSYVTTAVQAYETAAIGAYEASPPCIGGPSPCVAQPTYGGSYDTALGAGQFPTWTDLPKGGRNDQQLRGRGVYMDYLTDDLRSVVSCLQASGTAESCTANDVVLDRTGSTTILEILPFFDVQMTFLHHWNETPTGTPVETTDQPLLTDNAHSRGVIDIIAPGGSTVDVIGHRGNLGFTDTQPIDGTFASNVRSSSIHVEVTSNPDTNTPVPPPDSAVISGNFSEVIDGITLANITVEGQGGATCDRTPSGFQCTIPSGGGTEYKVRFRGYGIESSNTYACFTGANFLALVSEDTTGKDALATFSLLGNPQPSGPGYDIVFRTNPC